MTGAKYDFSGILLLKKTSYSKADYRKTLEKVKSRAELNENDMKVIPCAFLKIKKLDNNKGDVAKKRRRDGAKKNKKPLRRKKVTNKKAPERSEPSQSRPKSSDIGKAKEDAKKVQEIMKNAGINDITEVLEACAKRMKK